MAMTGGTAKQVKSGTPSGWPGSIKLYIYYKVKSQSVANNTTTLSLGAYITTPSGYWLEAWADNRGSYVGTATSGTNCKSFDGTLPYKTEGTYWLTENNDITVSHNADGTKSVTIYWKWGVYSSWGGFTNPSGNFSITLPTIPRTSSLTVPDSGVLGTAMSMSITREASSFRHTITYECGSASGTILDKSSSATSAIWTPPASLASQNTAGTSLSCKITLATYTSASAESAIGSVSKTITLSIPANSTFCPSAEATFSNVTSVPSGSLSILLQNKSRVRAAFSYTLKYGASIKSCVLAVGNNSVSGSSPLQTGILTNAGSNTIRLTITDSRGLQTTLQHTVSVLAYENPTVLPADGEEDVRAERCDEYGVWDGGGSSLRVLAKGGYTTLMQDGRDINSVTLRWRYRVSGGSWSAWQSFTGDTGAVEGVTLALQSTYQVEVGAVDALGYTGSTLRSIGTEAVFMHRTMDALGIGRYVTGRSKAVVISDEWDVEIGNLKVADVTVAGMPLADFLVQAGAILGLRKAPSIPSGSDLNDYRTPGVYAITSNAIAETLSNIPEAEAGTLRVWCGTGSGTISGTYVYLVQEYIHYRGQKRYVRYVETGSVADEWTFGTWTEK